ncbi:MAG: HAD-IIA family hydrolase [Erysipelotrichaceae bacterium]|jgi:HAD superfamily hydrolase (TIGR01457 family)|nr:HAD-IIA family hydrolase [Erysipelotrichaceae bacterium]
MVKNAIRANVKHKKRLICLDMDGTIYLGNQLFDGVKDIFKYFELNKINYVFLTNNSSHSLPFYVDKIRRMGITCSEDNFYSSIDTTIKFLQKENIRTVYVLGVTSFKEELKKHFTLVDEASDIVPEVTLVSFDTQLKYDELKAACLYIQKGSRFIATNMDYRCPIENGLYIPDCGGICLTIEACTNKKPQFLGKPAPEMLYQVMEKFGVSREETLMIGDRHYTDIMAGINSGVETVGVLTGETTKEEFLSAEHQPTYILDSIADLIEILEK